MAEVLYYAIPFFVLLLIVEYLSFRQLAHDDEDDPSKPIGFESKDTRTSLTMGLGNVIINAGLKFVVLLILTGVYELTPLRIPEDAWWAWVLLFFADDL